MAPVLRKKKSVAEIQKGDQVATKVVEKTAKIGKRKAPDAEDASPVSLKKQKPIKKSAVAPKSKKPKAPKGETTLEEDTALLHVDLSSSEDEDNVQALALQVDSDEDDVANGDSLFKPGQDVGKAPKISKALQKAANAASGEPGVLYIGRIPHGFYEHEMKQYFSQFGPINKIRLSRNKKTGASKHFAFLEFAEKNTAEIVAKTMDNYLLFGHILKCTVIPKEQVHDDLFKGANRRFKQIPWNKMAGNKLDKPLSESAWGGKVAKEQSKRTKKANKLKAIGYEFEAPQLKDVPAPAAIEAAVEVKAIEASEQDGVKTDVAVKVTETVSVVDSAKEPEDEVTSITTTKTKVTKTKAAKAGKAKKAKA